MHHSSKFYPVKVLRHSVNDAQFAEILEVSSNTLNYSEASEDLDLLSDLLQYFSPCCVMQFT